MAKRLVSKAEFARMAGISAAAVTKACRGILKPSVDGKRIDAAHPQAVEYLESKGWAPTPEIEKPVSPPSNAARKSPHQRGHAAKNEQRKAEALSNLNDPERTLVEIPADIRAFADMSLKELVQRFGTDIAFLDWLKATKMIEDVNEKRLKNAQTKGELVSRKLVKVGIVDVIESAHIELLDDGSKTIAQRVIALHGAGKPLKEIERYVEGRITKFIRPVKAKVHRALKNV